MVIAGIGIETKKTLMNAEIVAEIKNKLKEIETHYNVRILYACESGSRAWGFPSTDSDYDVRFIFAYNYATYLSIDTERDTIDIPVNEVLDINGWDIRKSLHLFGKSNAAIYEWLQSPIVYAEDSTFPKNVQLLMPDYFSPKDAMHHYLGVSKNAFSALDGNEIKLKKYFYCLRSLLAAIWIIKKEEAPPMEFHLLRTIVENEPWQNEIDFLLQLKTQSNESTLIKPHALLNEFITNQLSWCGEHAALLPKKEIAKEPLNKLFRESIHEF